MTASFDWTEQMGYNPIRCHHRLDKEQNICYPREKLQWLLECVGGVCFLSPNRFVELEIKMVLAITYLEFQTVYPLVATIHDSLVVDGPCSWVGSTINEPQTW